MKKLFLLIIIPIIIFLLHSCFKANDNIGHDGRCTGSTYCTACSNCSGCGHCAGGGGSCGVCKGESSGKKSSSKKDKHKRLGNNDSYSSKRGKSTKAPSVFVNEININSGRYIAGTAITYLYEKPSIQSKIIETVPKNEKLIQLSKQDSWYKVKVQKSGKIGYVYYKNVK